MKKIKNIQGLLGPWKNFNMNEWEGSKDHKFLNRDRTIQSNWKRVHDLVPEILLSDEKRNILDIGSGNGSTLEIFKYYGHSVCGMDYSSNLEKNNWLYEPLLKSQEITGICHDGSKIPYPFKNQEFDLVLCYGAITFFKPVENWPKILNEFARLSSSTILVGVNKGLIFDDGKKYLDGWKHEDFEISHCNDYIYKWKRK